MQSFQRFGLGILLSIGLLRPLHAQVPDYLKQPYWDLVKLNNLRQYPAAILQGKFLVAQEPKFPFAYGQLALAFEKAEQAALGLAYFDSLRQQRLDNPYVYYAIGMLEKGRKNFEQALGNLKMCIKLDPKYAPAYLQLTNVYNEQKDLETPASYFRALLQSDSLNAAAHYGLGCVYLFKKEWPKGAAAFARSLELDRELIHAYYLHGITYVNQRNFQKALEIWDKGKDVAARLNDIEWQSKMTGNVGNAYHDLGQSKQSVSYREEALKLARALGDRRQEMVHLSNLSTSDNNLGQYDKAMERLLLALEIAKEIDPAYQENIFWNLSAICNHKNDYKSSVKYATSALKMAVARGDSTAVAGHCINIGVAHAEQANYTLALHNYERALAIKKRLTDKRGVGFLLGNITAVRLS